MGASGPLVIVTPQEWIRRTSLTWSRRSESTRLVDAAYTAWHKNATSPQLTGHLMEALDTYLKEKGNDWSKVERNTASGGLMQYIYELVVEGSGSRVVPKGMQKLASYDIPHSRYGVLYLLGNLDINMDYLSISLEGVSAVGGAVGAGVTTNMGKLDNFKASAPTVDIGAVKDVKQQSLVSASQVPVKIAQGVLTSTGTKSTRDRNVYINERPPVRKVPGFPLTMAAYDAVREDPVLFLNPYVLPATAVVGVGAALYDAMNSLKILIENAVKDLYEWVMGKLMVDSSFLAESGGPLFKGLLKFVIAKCCEAAAPFVGGAMDLAGGIAKTFKAAKDKIGAWLLRRQIVLNPGHPEQMALSIEGEMQKGIFHGLWAMLKGVANLALSAFLPGAGSLVSALVVGVEWMIKFAWRLYEQSKIQKFLLEARHTFAAERKLAELVTEYRGKGTGLQLEPNMDPAKGGIIHDLDRFKAFFQKGCDASPLIPMMTLNSGICGSLMTLIKMFGDNSQHDMIAQSTYDAGNEYFMRLKQYGREYLAKSGFQFTGATEAVQGLVNHAVNDHDRYASTGTKLLKFAAS